jgi:hypothetical protein
MTGMIEMRLRDGDLAWTEVDDEIVALDETTAMYLAANEAGALLWRALASGATRDELVDLLAGTYALSPDRAAADTDAFVGSLRERGLLTD